MNTKNTLIKAILLAVFLSSPAISQDELLIIAPDEFIDELLPLMRFKEASARPTVLLRLSQVYNLNFQGDEPEQIKRCIAHYEQALGIDHVLLVGDVDKFPVRWRWWGRPDEEYWGASDLYYADLYENGTKNFDDWDDNNNGLYGEIEFAPDGTINNDEIDFLPDVSVGRIPASEPNEVTAYVNKVIAYELKTTPSDAWFKTAALYTGCWNVWDNWNKDKVGDSLENRGFNVLETSDVNSIRYGHWDPCPTPNEPDKMCCSEPCDMPETVINDMNSGLGFANYLGHGNAGGWAELGFSINDLTRLTNSGMLPIAFGAACDTGRFAWQARFHPYVDANGQEHCGTANGESLPPGPYPHWSLPRPHPVQFDAPPVGDANGRINCPLPGDLCPIDPGCNCRRCLCYNCPYDPHCFAENLLFGNPIGSGNGAIAYLGERTGGRSFVRMLDRYFFEAYDTGGLEVLGQMWQYMIEEYYIYYDLANANTWPHQPADWEWGHKFDEPQKLILFGDPSLIVGGAFRTALCGNVYDGNGGPLQSNSRYRLNCNVTVPAGQKLTANPGAPVAFESGKKITAIDANPSNGLVVNGTVAQPVCLLSENVNPQAPGIHGVRVRGQIRVRNGGEIKLY